MSSSTTQISICNKALRILGAKTITTLDDETEPARILNDVYDEILDEVLSSHPWNFAIVRANLTELGGTITTWTAEGTTNVWQAALTTEPAKVNFDGIEGTEQTSVAACNAERYWYWVSDVLYVYSTSDPDTAYTTIDAVIPEFGYDHAFQIPTDCLRVIRMEDDDAVFVIEADTRIFTDDSTCKIQYIARKSTPTAYSPVFITILAERLAVEIAFPVTNSNTKKESLEKTYRFKLKVAKSVDAQEGTGQRIDIDTWDEARK